MKKTTNAVQRHYIAAVALRDTLEAERDDMEAKYIGNHGITNPNGTVPTRIYEIMDDEVFDRISTAFDAQSEAAENWKRILAARETLKIAEAMLIEYGLSLAPARIRDTLSTAIKGGNYAAKQKIIDLVMRLDVSTVKRHA